MRIIQIRHHFLALAAWVATTTSTWGQTDSVSHRKIPLAVCISTQTGYLSAGSCAPLTFRMGGVFTLNTTRIGLEASASLIDLYDQDYPRYGAGVKKQGGLYFLGGPPAVHPSATALGVSFIVIQHLADSPVWIEAYGGIRTDYITEYDRHRSSGFISFGDTYSERYRRAWGQSLGVSLGYDVWKLPNFRCAPYIGVGWMRVSRYVPFTTSIIGLKGAFVLP